MNPNNPLYPIVQYAEQQEGQIADLQNQVSNGLQQVGTLQQQLAQQAAQISAQTAQITSLTAANAQQAAQIVELNREATIQRVIGAAFTFDFENIPYVFGGQWDSSKTLDKETFDCSGFMQCIWNIGTSGSVKLPRVSREQAKVGTTVKFEDSMIGDLFFYAFNKTGEVSHVAMNIGNGHIIQTNTPATGINLQKVDWNKGSIVSIQRVI